MSDAPNRPARLIAWICLAHVASLCSPCTSIAGKEGALRGGRPRVIVVGMIVSGAPFLIGFARR
ncbi:MAG: hypothetical protein WCA12_08450 [Burkholderiales bacterium]